MTDTLNTFRNTPGTFGMNSVLIAARGLESLLTAVLEGAQIPDATAWQKVGLMLDKLSEVAQRQLASGTDRGW